MWGRTDIRRRHHRRLGRRHDWRRRCRDVDVEGGPQRAVSRAPVDAIKGSHFQGVCVGAGDERHLAELSCGDIEQGMICYLDTVEEEMATGRIAGQSLELELGDSKADRIA